MTPRFSYSIAFGSVLPVLVVWAALLFCAFTGFNGLYGQDAHEYLRQCKSLLLRLQGLPPLPATPGELAFGAGYPLSGAVVAWCGVPPILAMQVVTWVSAGLGVYFFGKTAQLLLPGAKKGSYWTLSLVFVSAPVFWRCALTTMSDMLALALVLGALYQLLAYEHHRKGIRFVLAVLFACGAVLVRPAAVALVGPLGLAGLYWVFRFRQHGWLFWAVLGVGVFVGLYSWLKAPLGQTWTLPAMAMDWSPRYWLARHFETHHGQLHYTLPNLLYALAPLCHWGFVPLLPLVLLLFKKVDVHLPEKKILLGCLLVYSLLIAGLPVQSIRYLLPIWALLLLLLFPALDRVYSYGLYFLPKLVQRLAWGAVLVQMALILYGVRPLLLRNGLERTLAEAVGVRVPAGATVYGMDVDIALQSYLPQIRFNNLWVQRYDSFPVPAYVLFNEPHLSRQWAGQAPMWNWEKMAPLRTAPDSLIGGWVLWKLE